MSRKSLNKIHSNCLNRYTEHAKQKFEKTHIESRKSAIRQFLFFLETKNEIISEVDYDSVEDFFDYVHENGTSPVTINNYYSYLKGFFDYCKLHGDNKIMEYNKIEFSRKKYSNIEVYTDEEIVELFNIINTHKKSITKIRDRFMFNILFYTGCTLKELHSLNVYKDSSELKDDDFYILLDKKTIFFRNPNEREILIPNFIIEDIRVFITHYEDKLGIIIPNGSCLFISVYSKDDKGRKEFSRIRYSSLQNRMDIIKSKSSFANKKLSIKNTRHTILKKAIDAGVPVDVISEAFDIDIATLKLYFNEDTKIKNEITEFFAKKHPLKKLFKTIN